LAPVPESSALVIDDSKSILSHGNPSAKPPSQGVWAKTKAEGDSRKTATTQQKKVIELRQGLANDMAVWDAF
jgi:hypothetical protein